LEQNLIVSFSLKYQNYLRKIRQGQIERAQKLIKNGKCKKQVKNPNDPHRFISYDFITEDGEACTKKIPYLNTAVIAEEEKYDGFYAVCTNITDMDISKIVQINKKRWEIEECFRIMKTEFKAQPIHLQREDRIKAHFITCFISLVIYRILEKKVKEKYTCNELIHTLKTMMMDRPGEKLGYVPSYTRTDITDTLHETFGFRTDYEITTDMNMKKIIRKSKK
jgi:transposase